MNRNGGYHSCSSFFLYEKSAARPISRKAGAQNIKCVTDKSKTRRTSAFMRVFIGALDWIRTSGLQSRSLSLYPTGLQAHMKFLKVILRLRGGGHGTVHCADVQKSPHGLPGKRNDNTPKAAAHLWKDPAQNQQGNDALCGVHTLSRADRNRSDASRLQSLRCIRTAHPKKCGKDGKGASGQR